MRRSQSVKAIQAIQLHNLAFDGHATVSVNDARDSAPKTSVSTIKISTRMIEVVIRNVRSQDLVTYCSRGVQIVVTATHDEAWGIAERLESQLCDCTGIIEIHTAKF